MNDEKVIPITCESTVKIRIDEIHDLQGNFKTLTTENLKKLTKSFIEYGISFPLFVWRNPADNNIYSLDGHQRLKAMYELRSKGYQIDEVPVVFVNCKDESEAREKLLLVCSMYGVYDKGGAIEFVSKINNKDRIKGLADLSGIDLQKILNILNEKADPEIIPPALPNPVCKRGELWILGEHRVICGDSTVVNDVQKLLQNEKPLLLVTDPPYGVDYGSNAGMWRMKIDGSQNRKTGTFLNDNRSDWSDAYKLFDAEIAYVYHGGLHAGTVQQSLENCGYEIKAQIIWYKQHFALSRGCYHWQHEPCWYAVKDGENSEWSGDRKQTTVWEISNSNPFGGNIDDCNSNHSTQKPLECMAKPIRLHGQTGCLVVDPFLGSGTTLIACQREGRRCYGMELEPLYCDIILQRWADYTGKDPVREDGMKWSELKQSKEVNNDRIG